MVVASTDTACAVVLVEVGVRVNSDVGNIEAADPDIKVAALADTELVVDLELRLDQALKVEIAYRTQAAVVEME